MRKEQDRKEEKRRRPLFFLAEKEDLGGGRKRRWLSTKQGEAVPIAENERARNRGPSGERSSTPSERRI